MERIITNSMIGDFENYLRSDEKSDNTIEKYLRDVRSFTAFAEAREISKAVVMEFKASLAENYEITSANSMIAAVNAFCGLGRLLHQAIQSAEKGFLLRRKGINKSGVYPSCKYRKAKRQ